MFIDYIEAELGPASYRADGSEASWNCPFCTARGEGEDTRERFGFNEDKMLGHCFNCGWRGNAVTFVRDIRGVSWKEAIDAVNTYTDYRPLPTSIFDAVYEKLYLDGMTVTEVKNPPPLPADFTPMLETASPLKDRYIRYAQGRGVTERQMHRHRMGYCYEGRVQFASGKETHLDRHLFINEMEAGTLRYWMARALTKQVIPKTFNPPASNTILGKSDIVFNIDGARALGTAVITEGVFDALTVGDAGVALYGKMMSTQQFLTLTTSGISTAYVMLDPDARRYALEICARLSRVLDAVYFVDIRHGDPNDLGPRGCMEALSRAERYTPATAIRMKLTN